MRSTEIACYLSHISVIRRCLAEGIERAVIVEDDVVPSASFAAALAQLERAPAAFEFVRLIGTRKRAFLPIAKLTDTTDIVWPTHGLCGAQGYYLTRPAMEKVARAGEQVILPFDVMLDRYWRTDLTIFALHPFVLHDPETTPSDIGARPDSWNARPQPWLRAKLKARKFRERLARHWANLHCRARLGVWRRLGHSAFAVAAAVESKSNV